MPILTHKPRSCWSRFSNWMFCEFRQIDVEKWRSLPTLNSRFSIVMSYLIVISFVFRIAGIVGNNTKFNSYFFVFQIYDLTTIYGDGNIASI